LQLKRCALLLLLLLRRWQLLLVLAVMLLLVPLVLLTVCTRLPTAARPAVAAAVPGRSLCLRSLLPCLLKADW
jgi:hypothetical protein